MQVREVLAMLDTMRPNAFSDGEKLYLLNTIEGRIYREIIEMAEPEDTPTQELPQKPQEPEGTEDAKQEQEEKPPALSFRPFLEGEEERELIVPIPYTDIYFFYLAAMIDFYNADSGRYNDTMVLFNQAWADYAAYYRQTHKPKQTNLTGMLPHRERGFRL